MAIKILKDDVATEYVKSLFRQEADLLSKLEHPNIIKIFHLIKLDEIFYLGMEYVADGNLSNYLRGIWTKGKRFSDQDASKLI